uniref:Ribonuclease 3 n=2 Tax=Culex pipiens TaxID=7175 RepID=A0A8D8FR72_CULPI
MDGGEPDIPIFKVIECNGPTNTRVYTMGVYFRGKRLACSNGHSIQQAEVNAAKQALENSKDLFPQLDHQKHVIAQSLKRQKVRTGDRSATSDAILWIRARTRTGSDAARWCRIRPDCPNNPRSRAKVKVMTRRGREGDGAAKRRKLRWMTSTKPCRTRRIWDWRRFRNRKRILTEEQRL